jgi:hypothetical protein
MKDGLDDGACRNGEGVRDYAEIDAQLIAQQRQHDEQADQDYQPIRLQPRNGRSGSPRENPHQDAPPSSGGSGNKLNTASTTLMINAFFKFSTTHFSAVAGR